MKRIKKIGILCGIFLCVSFAALGVNQYEEHREMIKNSDAVILKVDSQKVTSLSWECSTGSFAFHRDEEGGWVYDEDGEFPVDGEQIQKRLDLFEEFGVSFVIEKVEDFGQYGLDQPVCTIHMETEEETCEILLGNYSAMDSQRYVSIGDGNAYLVKTDPLDLFEIQIPDVIRHDPMPELGEVTRIQVSGGETEQILYQEDSAGSYSSEDVYFWKKGDTLLPLDTSRVQAYLDTIENLNLKDYVNYKASQEDLAAYGLDTPELSVSIDYKETGEDAEETKDGTFVLHISRDPAEREEKDARTDRGTDASGEETGEETGGDGQEEEVTAYARAGDSRIIYRLTTDQYHKLTDCSYDALRHRELFWGDFADVYKMDILLEGNQYTITSQMKNRDRTYYYQGEELEMASIRSAIRGLRAGSFTEQKPEQKEEISLTLYLDNDRQTSVHIQLYRHDGKDCIAVVDGTPVAYVEREQVVDLMEAVYRIVLETTIHG